MTDGLDWDDDIRRAVRAPGTARGVRMEHDPAWERKGYDTIVVSGLTRRFGHTAEGLLVHSLLHRVPSCAVIAAEVRVLDANGGDFEEDLDRICGEFGRNLGQLRLRPTATPDGPDGPIPIVGSIRAEGPCVVSSGDIEWHHAEQPDDGVVCDEDVILCSIDANITVEVSLSMAKGRGAYRMWGAEPESDDPSSRIVPVSHVSMGPVQDVKSHVEQELSADGSMEDSLVLRIRCKGGYPADIAFQNAAAAALDFSGGRTGTLDAEWLRETTSVRSG